MIFYDFRQDLAPTSKHPLNSDVERVTISEFKIEYDFRTVNKGRVNLTVHDDNGEFFIIGNHANGAMFDERVETNREVLQFIKDIIF